MKQKTRKKSFDIYLPATAEKEAELVETIDVEVYEKFGEEFLTPESNEGFLAPASLEAVEGPRPARKSKP